MLGLFPLYIDSLGEEEAYYNLPLTKRRWVLNLFRQNNVVTYITSYTHKSVINNYENYQLVSGETAIRNFNKNPLGYRIWEVSSD